MRGWWLLAARVVWFSVALSSLAIIVFSLPDIFGELRTVCAAGEGACTEQGGLTPEDARSLRDVGLSVDAYATFSVTLDTLFRLVWFGMGAVIFWLRSDDRMALLVSLFLVSFGTVTFNSDGADALISADPALWWLPGRGMQVLGEVCAVLFFLLFPSGRFVPGWTRWLAVAFLALQVPVDLYPGLYSGPDALEIVQGLVFMGFLFGMLGFQIYRYRNVSPSRERDQTKWVVFGTTLAILGLLVFVSPLLFAQWRTGTPTSTPLALLMIKGGFTLSMLLIPLSIGVAVLRSRLFDIDVVINRALVYATLTATLALVYVGGIVALQWIFRAVTGQASELAVVASTLAIAALFVPLRRRIQATIDRRFYRKKYDAAKTVAAFSVKLRDERDLGSLNGELVGAVRRTVQPAHVSLWLRPPEKGG